VQGCICRCNCCNTLRLSTTDVCPTCSLISNPHEIIPAAAEAQPAEGASSAPCLSVSQLLPPVDSHNRPAGHARSTSAQVSPPVLDAEIPPSTRAPKRRRMDVPCVVGLQSSPARKLLRQLELPGDCFNLFSLCLLFCWVRLV
jgi:hypothetical protein